jgi:hypothetical protein
VLAGLRSFLAKGMSLRAAAAKLGRPKTTLGRLAQRQELRRGPATALSPETKARLKRCLARGWGGRRVAREVGVSRRTVWKYQQLAKFRTLINRSQTPLPCKPWRCPAGGELLCLSICIVHGERKPPSAPKTGTGKTRRRSA